MTNLQKIALRLSEVRQRLNTISGLEGEALTDEVRAESTTLQGEFSDLETRHRAAIVADPEIRQDVTTEDAEARELRLLTEAANAGDVLQAAIEHRMTEGQTRELQEHYKLGSNQIPLALLSEHRATGVTPAPATVGATQAEIIPAVFPMSCAAFLGIDMPTVGVGEAIFPVLTTSADAGVPAENAEQDETAGGFEADNLAPSRIQASFRFSREDRARFAGMDSALRENLNMALGDKLDQQILNGGEGLFHSTNLANNAASAEDTFATYKSNLAYGRVDGKWAASVGDLRIVVGSGTFAHAATKYRGNNASESAIDELMTKTAGVKVSAHVPAVAANKQNAVIRLGMRRDMVAPIWEGVTLIPDEITKAADGQIVITAVMLHAVSILRSGGFYKQQTQHA